VLRLTDVNGNTFDTPSVQAVTDIPRTRHLVIFDGSMAPDQYQLLPLPPAYGVVGDGGVEGGPSLYYDAPNGTTFQNLRIDDLRLSVDSSLTDKLFAYAYVEFWIHGIGTPGSSWSNVWIRTFEPDGSSCTDFPTCIYQYSVDWLYHPDPAPGRYRRVQIPLSQFSLQSAITNEPFDGGGLTIAVLMAKAIDEFNVGCPYATTDKETTALDAMAIWW
jgi:hypothetical protein